MENGVKYVDKISPEVVDWMKKITDKVRLTRPHPTFLSQSSLFTFQPRIFSLGCFYRKDKWMSMYGHVTDAQVFSRDLTDQEMIDITNCRQVLVKYLYS